MIKWIGSPWKNVHVVVIIKYIMKKTPTKYHDFNIFQECHENQIHWLKKNKRKKKLNCFCHYKRKKVLILNLPSFSIQFDFQFYWSKHWGINDTKLGYDFLRWKVNKNSISILNHSYNKLNKRVIVIIINILIIKFSKLKIKFPSFHNQRNLIDYLWNFGA